MRIKFYIHIIKMVKKAVVVTKAFAYFPFRNLNEDFHGKQAFFSTGRIIAT